MLYQDVIPQINTGEELIVGGIQRNFMKDAIPTLNLKEKVANKNWLVKEKRYRQTEE